MMDDKPMTKEECTEAQEAIRKGEMARVQPGMVVKYLELHPGASPYADHPPATGHRALVIAVHKKERRMIALSVTGNDWGRLVELQERSRIEHLYKVRIVDRVLSTRDWSLPCLAGIGETDDGTPGGCG